MENMQRYLLGKFLKGGCKPFFTPGTGVNSNGTKIIDPIFFFITVTFSPLFFADFIGKISAWGTTGVRVYFFGKIASDAPYFFRANPRREKFFPDAITAV